MKKRSHDPICYALDIFGDKWSLIIIRDIMFSSKRTYGEFLASKEGIATNILANRLSELKKAGILTSRKDPEKKTRIFYTLTEKGIRLVPIMIEIIRWSATYDKASALSKSEQRRIKGDRERYSKEIIEKLRKRKL
jgi:DNA-binding HxlR family transcriptional regulator